MTDTLRITIHFFGAFRQFSKYFNDENHFTLKFCKPCTIADIRAEFNQQLKIHCRHYNEQLLMQSFFANDDRILHDVTLINTSVELCIIPPVSGG